MPPRRNKPEPSQPPAGSARKQGLTSSVNLNSKPMPLTMYQAHVQAWKDCDRCLLHATRRNVVLSRGRVPCQVLLIGEGPGESEDVLAKPFVGPAGKLLDQIIERAIGTRVTYALTNMVACIPRDEEGGKAGEPQEEALDACRPRVEQFVKICQPKLIVGVGRIAEDFLKPGYTWSLKLPQPRPKVIAIVHPASILRANVMQQGLAVQKCIVTISNAVDDILEFGETGI